MLITIRDVSRRPNINVTGKLIKRYENGLTIDDERGVRYFAYHDNVIGSAIEKKPTDEQNGLW